MNFSGFTSVDFTAMNQELKEFVYVLCWKDGAREVPFYVGQTKRIWGRMDDYYWADFAACTDFRVGEAIRYISDKGCRVVIKYRLCTNSREEEKRLIDQIGKENLLNGFPAFDYRNADPDAERERVRTSLSNLLFLSEQHPSGKPLTSESL